MGRKSETRAMQTDQAISDVPASVTDEKEKRQIARSIARNRRHVQGREDKKTRVITGAERTRKEARQREDKRMRRIAAAGWVF
jgi:hypothetical protein